MTRGESYWRELVARAERVNLAIRDADVNHLWFYGGPSSGADDAALAAMEAAIGSPLDPDYRQFLMISNGWEGFYGDVDLFSCADYPSSARLEHSWMMIGAAEEGSGGLISFDRRDWIPIGVSREEVDIFMLRLPAGRRSNVAVVWMTGGDVEEYDSVAGFFEAMIGYSEANLADVRADPWLRAG